jgi:hypothetical protein
MNARPLCVALLAFSGVLASGLTGCGSSDDAAFSSSVAPGTERGACRSDGSCDTGLECRSDLCVSAGGGSGSGGGNSSNTGGSSNISAAGDSSSNAGTINGSGGTDAVGGSNATGGTVSGAGAGPGGADGAGGAAVQCEGVHPLVSDKNRYCEVGSCYCNDPFDTCFSEETATACCSNAPRCGDQPADRGVNCTGSHPIIEPIRTCAPGNCFCSDGDAKKWDVCLPKAVAASCCPPGVSLTCVE